MFSFSRGTPVAVIKQGKYDKEILLLATLDDCCDNHKPECSSKKLCCKSCKLNQRTANDLAPEITLSDGKLIPLVKLNERTVEYIAAPSGSGKSTMANNLIKLYYNLTKKPLFVFSRTNFRDDPAIKDLPAVQIDLTKILTQPIDITKDFPPGSLLLFDDITTIGDEKVRKYLEYLIKDILEVGRKLNLYIVITNHLVIPDDRKYARTIMNELQFLTIFPKSGSAQQIKYALKTYFGLTSSQVNKILDLNSRWVRISKNYPQYVLYDKGAYLL